MKKSNNVTLKPISTDKKVPFYKNSYLMMALFICLFSIIFNLKFTFAIVQGSSMEPTYKNGNLLLTEKHTNINRFDCVIVNTPEKLIIKRVIGLPGETIEYKDNQLYINGKLTKDNYGSGKTDDFKFTVSDNCYYCLGDNRENSLDSRYFGEFSKENIYSKVIWR